ncbi:uncharacterized protein BDZ99DRAFT_34731 [Mytilinidion resinicola]|uniref:Uncharacterized protein n=1 Tax=Mytilinidion resinicola TaxID=574789 RepID=A0A6A6YP02_9PEZI|nr:uncharacterized protein BDZ99DRAFT_34731 [Mytilinidion resinicola]KAF2809705.1 hypothetical protein BDZ99DRAFT_34731 [Mytilinidion resinicola]
MNTLLIRVQLSTLGEPRDGIIPISTPGSEHVLTVKKLYYVPEVPEYPDSDDNGVAYLVQTTGFDEKQYKMSFENVQFCHKLAWKGPSKNQLFNNVKCIRSNRLCTGVRYCEYLSPSIRDMTYTSLQPEDWEKIQNQRVQHGSSTLRKQANS